MTRLGSSRIFKKILAATIALAAIPAVNALAQCAMCRAAIAGDPNAKAASDQMDIAVLLLLVPAVLIFGGVFALIYRYRDALNRPRQQSHSGGGMGF